LKSLDIIENKIIKRENALPHLIRWRFKNKKVVFTNGCFDILHQGHLDYLSKAADLGDKLIVAVNSDASVKVLDKGPERPLQGEMSRALLIASLHFVDMVILFEENTPYELIAYLKPDVLVKGSDYKIEEIAGSDIVIENGGEVKTLPFLDGFSTSKIVEKIKQG